MFLPGNLIFSWLWSIFRPSKKSEFLQNGVLHQSLCCSFSEASHVSPMTQLPGKPLKRTEEIGDQSSKGYGGHKENIHKLLIFLTID